MWSYYVLALIPVLGGAVLWLGTRRITFSEWMRGVLLGFLIAGGFHACTMLSQTIDWKTVSGFAIAVAHCPECTVESGDDTEFLPERWIVIFEFGDLRQSFEIAAAEFDELARKFGGTPRTAKPEDFEPVDEDYRITVIDNNAGTRVPGFSLVLSSKIPRSGPSVLSFDEPPAAAPLFDYPIGLDPESVAAYVAGSAAANLAEAPSAIRGGFPLEWRRSRRLLGRAARDFSIGSWDRLNADLYPTVGVNLIAIGFDGDSTLAHYQEAAWQGGKRNDLVLCYGPARPDGSPQWTYCFGWSEDELVRRNLESLLLRAPPSDEVVPAIRNEVEANYRERTWPELHAMQLPAPPGSLTRLLLVMAGLQGGYWWIALRNRARRKAADDRERAEVEAEKLERIQESRDRSDRDRIRRELPGVDANDAVALIAAIQGGADAYIACLALRRLDRDESVTGLVVAVTAESFRARELASRWLDERVRDPRESTAVEAAIPLLIPRLGHAHPTTRAESRRILEAMDPDWTARPEAETARNELLAELDHGITSRRRDRRVEDALGGHGSVAFESLRERAERGDPVALQCTLPAMGMTSDRRALSRIARSMEAGGPRVRAAALEALAHFGVRRAQGTDEAGRLYEAVEQMLESSERADTRTRLLLIGAHEALADLRSIPWLLKLAEDADRKVRTRAIRVLGEIGDESTLDALFHRISRADHRERVALVRAVGTIGGPSIVQPLCALFDQHREGGSLLPETIVHALFPLGGPEVLALLEREAHDPMGPVPELAALRLDQLQRNFEPPGWDLTATGWKNRLGAASTGATCLDRAQ